MNPASGTGRAARIEIERRQLGSSPVSIPRVALGAGNFGGVGSAPEFFGHGLGEDAALELMDAAWDMGITHFDTADAYGGGRSESAIGRWIASRGLHPTITTKTYNPMSAGGDHGLAPERIVRQLDSSLERLGVDGVELYLAHDFDPDVPLRDTLAAFAELAETRRVAAYGVSNFTAAQLEEALAAGSPQAIQNSYSLLERDDAAEVLPLCRARGVSYLAFGPLSGGWLTGKYRRGQPYPAGSRMTQRPQPYQRLVSDHTFATLERLEAFAHHRGISLAGLALAWVLAEASVAQVVVGPGSPEHLEPLREALERPLTEDEVVEIDALMEA